MWSLVTLLYNILFTCIPSREYVSRECQSGPICWWVSNTQPSAWNKISAQKSLDTWETDIWKLSLKVIKSISFKLQFYLYIPWQSLIICLFIRHIFPEWEFWIDLFSKRWVYSNKKADQEPLRLCSLCCSSDSQREVSAVENDEAGIEERVALLGACVVRNGNSLVSVSLPSRAWEGEKGSLGSLDGSKQIYS